MRPPSRLGPHTCPGAWLCQSVPFDSVMPTPSVDSFAPALLAPEGLPLAVSRAVTLTAWVPFGPTFGCSLTCIVPDAAPLWANFQLLFLQLSQAFGSRTCSGARLWLKNDFAALVSGPSPLDPACPPATSLPMILPSMILPSPRFSRERDLRNLNQRFTRIRHLVADH